MIKLPTVKIGGQTAFVINRNQVEDDVAVAEAICRDAERYRWLRENAAIDYNMTADEFDKAIDNGTLFNE